MRTIVITPPAPVVLWEDARAHLRLDTNDEQDLVTGMIAAATAALDGPTGWLGRSLGPQVLETRFDGFGFGGLLGYQGCTLALPYGPVIAVQSVGYLDATGAAQAVDVSGWEVIGDQLEPAFGRSWPSTALRREAVRIRYAAGYAADPEADPLVAALPAPIRAAILLMVGDLFANRQTVETGVRAAAVSVPMSTTVEALLAPYRVFG